MVEITELGVAVGVLVAFQGVGSALHTSASVHFATTGPICQARQNTLDTARAAHPDASRDDRPHPRSPTTAGINQPAQELQKIQPQNFSFGCDQCG